MKCAIMAAILSAATLVPAATGQALTPVDTDDLEAAIGDDWTGELTYLNYGEPVQDFTIPAELDVVSVENGLELYFQYPEEPSQNIRVTWLITDEGKSLAGEPIIASTEMPDGTAVFVTAAPCEDMGKSAACQMTYSLSATELTIKKMVQYDGEDTAFRRNAYRFER